MKAYLQNPQAKRNLNEKVLNRMGAVLRQETRINKMVEEVRLAKLGGCGSQAEADDGLFGPR